MSKLPMIAPNIDSAHRRLMHAHPGAQIVSRVAQVVRDASQVPAVIADLIRREAEHPDALDSVVIVSPMYDEQYQPIAGQVAVAIAHALPTA